MIAVDTSALIAIALDDAQAQACRDALEGETAVVMSAATLVEVLVVSFHKHVGDEVNRIVEGLGIEIVLVTEASARRAVAAYNRWGRGVHPAGLNFGDCFSYEVAQAHDCSLLFVGEDFSRADVKVAM